MPFTSMVIRADGSAAPCCESTQAAARPDGERIHFYKDRLADAFNSPLFREIREKMLAGERHPSCQSCWVNEDRGLASKRRHENGIFWLWRRRIIRGKQPSQPIDFSLNLGNQCNLKCRICGPTSSSRWAAEYLELFGEDHVPRDNPVIAGLGPEESRSLLTNWPYKDENFTPDFLRWLKQARRLEFLGGEPFLNRKQFELVKASAEKGYARKQRLTFVTNGSIYPGDEAVNHWKRFREVNVNVSADGIGPQFEYQRYGAKWEDATQNIARYRALKQVSCVNVMVTASIFNVYYLPEIYKYWQSQGVKVVDCAPNGTDNPAIFWDRIYGMLNLNVLTLWWWHMAWIRVTSLIFRRPPLVYTSYVFNPHRFDIRVLPRALKEAVAKKFRECQGELSAEAQLQLRVVADQMLSEDLSHLWPKTLESIWFHDRYRKQKFAHTFPEFYAEATRLGVWYDYETQKDFFFPNGIPAAAAPEKFR